MAAWFFCWSYLRLIGFLMAPIWPANPLTQVAPVPNVCGAQVPDDAPLAEVTVPPPADVQPAVLAPEQIVMVTGAGASGGLRVHADASQDAPIL
ncbi:MAG: hypothetical protein R2911_33455 [Caldilineaceae bacterium]